MSALKLTDTNEALTFDATIVPEFLSVSYVLDILQIGLSPGFRIPPKRAVENAGEDHARAASSRDRHRALHQADACQSTRRRSWSWLGRLLSLLQVVGERCHVTRTPLQSDRLQQPLWNAKSWCGKRFPSRSSTRNQS
jgi:hypothetical protein